jgi:hypothetical protein
MPVQNLVSSPVALPGANRPAEPRETFVPGPHTPYYYF